MSRITITLICVGILLSIAGFTSSIISNSNHPGVVNVYIAGAISKPNVYKLHEGSRIIDLINLAGGITSEADDERIEKDLNLAQILIDGAKVYIPYKKERVDYSNVPKVSAKSSNAASVREKLVSINQSSIANLDELPGIGEVTAKKIIANRPYTTIDELVFKKIVKNSVFEKIKHRLIL